MKFLRLGFFISCTLFFLLYPPPLEATGAETVNVPILCYHRVGPKVKSIYDLTPEMLEAQLQFFKENNYQPITGIQYLKHQKHPADLPEKPVVMTFDDGNKDHYTYVFPLLKKYGFAATFFVYPEAIAEKSDSQITWGELSEMAQAGMDIESHTFTHPFLTATGTRPDDPVYLRWLEHELRDSRILLEQKIQRNVALLAYPYGWYNCIIETEAFLAGYQGAFTVNWGTNSGNEDLFRLKRRAVSNNLSLFELGKYLGSRSLPLEILSPRDTSIVEQKPLIKFRVLNPEIRKVNIIISKNKGEVSPDDRGVFVFSKFNIAKPGYYMIIVSGYDQEDQLYINSWGFDYQKSAKPVQ
ncbi:MAG: polysaccharide deacetylase family protein [Bacillota bacterium]